MALHTYIGARYVPNFLGTYDNTQSYEAMDVVDNGSGTSYIAKKPTPAGTPLTNTNYWFLYGASSGAIVQLQNDMIQAQNDINSLKPLLGTVGTPSMYGAVGDGVTDDTNAIQDCINNHNVIDLEYKTYLLNSAVNLKSNLIIKNGSFVCGNTIQTVIGNNISNVIIDNVTITPAYVQGTNANNRINWFPIEFNGCSNIKVVNSTFICRDCRTLGFISCSLSSVVNCDFINVEGTALTFVACTEMLANANRFDGQDQYDRSWHMFDVYGKNGSCQGVIIDACMFSKVHGDCIQFTSTPGTYDIKDSKIVNCVFINNGECVIKIDGVRSKVVIEGCLMDGINYFGDATSGYALSLGGQSGGAYDVSFINNIVQNFAIGYVVSHNDGADVDLLEVSGCHIENVFRIYTGHTGYCNNIIFCKNTVINSGIRIDTRTTSIPAESIYRIEDNIFDSDSTAEYIRVYAGMIKLCNNILKCNAAQNNTSIVFVGEASAVYCNDNIVYKKAAYSGVWLIRALGSVATMFFNGNIYDGNTAPDIETPSNITTLVKYSIAP